MKLTEFATKAGIGGNWARKAIHQGIVKTTMIPVKEGSAIMRHDISEEELKKFMNRERHSGRPDGRTKFIAYFTEEELAAVIKAAPNAPKPVRPKTYVKKSKGVTIKPADHS